MGIFDELIGGDLSCIKEDLEVAPKVGTAREQILRSCQRVDMPTVTPGVLITLKISGPVTHAVLMGKGLVG